METLLPYDRALVFPEGNAVPVAAEELPKAAGRMYHALSPEAGHFFDEMVRHDLLDPGYLQHIKFGNKNMYPTSAVKAITPVSYTHLRLSNHLRNSRL